MPDVPKKKVIPPIQQDPPHNLKVLTKKHNDEKLAITIVIVGACSLAYNFW